MLMFSNSVMYLVECLSAYVHDFGKKKCETYYKIELELPVLTLKQTVPFISYLWNKRLSFFSRYNVCMVVIRPVRVSVGIYCRFIVHYKSITAASWPQFLFFRSVSLYDIK